MTKACFKCKRELPVTEFYRHPQMKDGTVNKCKDCNRADVRLNYRAKQEHYRSYYQQRERRAERKAWQSLKQRRLRAKDPEKYRARHAVSNALRDGRLQKLPCVLCGNTASQAHHEDYTKPLEVEWLCFRCHREHRHGQALVPF